MESKKIFATLLGIVFTATVVLGIAAFNPGLQSYAWLIVPVCIIVGLLCIMGIILIALSVRKASSADSAPAVPSKSTTVQLGKGAKGWIGSLNSTADDFIVAHENAEFSLEKGHHNPGTGKVK